jgi:hypothetical protein
MNSKKSMNHIINTFPLLEDTDILDTCVPSLAHERITWLERSSQASHAEFVLKLLKIEPQANAFHATVQIILTMSTDIRDQWIKLETAVAAKKIETNLAHITKLYSHYSIAVSNKRNRKDNSLQFKFPHEKK